MLDATQDLIQYIDASPTPYHAVAETARRLEAAGYTRLSEADAWSVEAGGKHYAVRQGGSIVAFERGSEDIAAAGCRIVGAHTDSPNLRVKPHGDQVSEQLRTLPLDPYGGILLHTWFDRDLSLAGRVVLRDGSGGTRSVLLDLEAPVIRVANLAIHLQAELRTEGFKPNKQQHLGALMGTLIGRDLKTLLAEALDAAGEPSGADDLLAFDLMAYDTQGAAVGGTDGEWLFAARLDNLASCHAGLSAMLAASEPAPFTRVLACWDHEEVGSRSAEGAQGSFLGDVIRRLCGSDADDARARAASFMISADMAHAVHPGYPERHEPAHMPRLGAGPVLKVNVNQSYASNAETGARFAALCNDSGVALQRFVNRADLGCGSTIGPLASTRLGIPTVDVGSPMLSMHSIREMCATADIAPMISVLRAHLRSS